MLKAICVFCLLILQSLSAERILVGIAGGTGSGKTTFAQKIYEHFSDRAILFAQDSYYKDLSHLPIEERAKSNFDHPDSIDFETLKADLRSLKQGATIAQPIYNFNTHCREAQTLQVEPAELIIVEGILLFTDAELFDIFDFRVYIDAEDDIRILRRADRDIHERSRTLASVTEQYIKTVKPMHNLFVEPSKFHADIIIYNGGPFNKKALSTIITKLERDLSL